MWPPCLAAMPPPRAATQGRPYNEKAAPKRSGSRRSGSEADQAILTTLLAAGPFWPETRSYSTRSPSASDLKPLPWIAEWWTKQSFEPSSGVMNPNPLLSLNHFTFPVIRILQTLFLGFPQKHERDPLKSQVPLRSLVTETGLSDACRNGTLRGNRGVVKLSAFSTDAAAAGAPPARARRGCGGWWRSGLPDRGRPGAPGCSPGGRSGRGPRPGVA